MVTVCYNSTAVLPQMLDSVPPSVPVVLVDNGSADVDDLKKLAQRAGAALVSLPENLGFGTGCNRGAAVARTPFILFLNPDTVLSQGCIDALETAADTYPDASAFNPRLLDRKGKVILRRRTRLNPEFVLQGPVPDTPAEIPTLLGAAIFLRRDIYDRIDGFDENIFLYHEDDDLSLRLRGLGPLMTIPQAVVTHSEGRSTARTGAVAAFKAYHLARSKVYAYTKHGRPRPFLRTLLEGVSGLFSPLMLIPRKRAKAVGFLKGAWSARNDKGRGRGTLDN
ncbi:glycosyltransferase family 2 protein [Sulfitobacter sp. TSTF-M16]|uniref:Glycosyltransferase family 2 protein n=1 Tax=Sulfitobacter aestuariivivens TaxID=2766981 RepID=A0A927D7A6_9RHOB|nr:glycosyltransferase family 2 protein [Sulfitobacter aestuariivivens]